MVTTSKSIHRATVTPIIESAGVAVRKTPTWITAPATLQAKTKIAGLVSGATCSSSSGR
jgi:hypothetical protein